MEQQHSGQHLVNQRQAIHWIATVTQYPSKSSNAVHFFANHLPSLQILPSLEAMMIPPLYQRPQGAIQRSQPIIDTHRLAHIRVVARFLLPFVVG
jgi:hypothetical protein